MTKFADQLFDDLMHEHGEALASVQRPVTKRGRAVRHPVWLAGLAAGAAGAGTASVVLLGGNPAYALTENTDGTMKVAISRPSGIAEANSALHGKDINVVLVPVRAGCPDLDSLAVPTTGKTKFTGHAQTNGDGSITVDVTNVPAGQTALIGVDSSNGQTTMAMALIQRKAPDCVSLSPNISGPKGNTGGVHNSQDDGGPGTSKAGG